MDVIAAWQAGIKNGIALGTSLTNQQIQHIEDVWQKELVFCYDGG